MDRYFYEVTLMVCPILPLESDLMIVKILEEDPRSRIIAEPKFVSVLTRHPNSAMGICALLESQPQSLIFKDIILESPD
jgi:hypothetical protein